MTIECFAFDQHPASVTVLVDTRLQIKIDFFKVSVSFVETEFFCFSLLGQAEASV